ncbi:quinone oxidoreductase family protein [Amycolatopsis orientalis]|uniref:quinone oxidoreductase family protein n=1 Tax=Amycolatopsis orientalis TaxID=31958 RepID=UPI0003A01959|nr:zinc-binding alcohol dehydrogenase family protein [Amycolatopsis orientalis]
MKAARFPAWGADPVVDEVPEPVRGDGEVLVDIQAAAVAHLDVTVASGTFGLKPRLPYIGGVEGAGIVVACDEDSGLEPGCQVMLRGGGLGLKRDGTWTERASVPAKAVTRLAAPLAPEVAATFFVPATTAFVTLHDVAKLGADEEVIVVGAAGAVGAMVAQQARLAGAKVTGVVGRAEQLADVPDGVVGVCLDSAEDTERLARDRPASLLVDTLGGDGLITRSRWVRPGGRAAVIGYVTGAEAKVDLPSWLLDDVALLPVNMIRREREAREACGDLIKKLSEGELEVRVQRYRLADAGAALADLKAGRVRGRAVLVP